MEIGDYETVKNEMILSDFEFIVGYENLYKINKKGEIYTCWYNRIMKPSVNQYGYQFVSLVKGKRDDQKRVKCFIHRLIALQWIPNPENKPEVDHIDRDRLNNSIENLRWVSRTENANNKKNNVALLSVEDLEKRNERTKERARVWAENKRRENGIPSKSEMVKTKDPEYYNNWAKEKRESETPEQKEARLKLRRDKYAQKKEEERLNKAMINSSTEL
jgi:hypothetical protein